MTLGKSPVKTAQELFDIIERDKGDYDRLDRYWDGDHDMPFLPADADREYEMLAQRSVTNLIPLVVNTSVQMLYIDGFTRNGSLLRAEEPDPIWEHWHKSRLDAKQSDLWRSAARHSMAYLWASKESRDGKPISRALSATRTAAIFEYPASDLEPLAALTLRHWEDRDALGVMWDGRNKYEVSVTDGKVKSARLLGPHGASTCPVTRFSVELDLEGRATGLMEPLMSVQDRLNQTVFDLLVAQTYNSFVVRTATGMVPPPKMQMVDGVRVPVRDANGDIVPDPIQLSKRNILVAEDPEAKFGHLPGSRLDGFIEAVDLAFRHMSVIGQIPPPYALGQIANLSAEALGAADTGQGRKLELLKHSFGESMERQFSVVASLLGDESLADDLRAEVRWRDMSIVSESQVADSLIKLSSLGIPPRALWERVPSVTRDELARWEDARREDGYDTEAFRSFMDTAGALTPAPTRPEVLIEPTETV